MRRCARGSAPRCGSFMAVRSIRATPRRSSPLPMSTGRWSAAPASTHRRSGRSRAAAPDPGRTRRCPNRRGPHIGATGGRGPISTARRMVSGPVSGYISPMILILLVIHILVAFALVGVVLLQKSEGGALGVGGMSGFMTGRTTANLLTRATAILAATFFVTSVLLVVMHNRARAPVSIIDQGVPTAPAQPSVPLAPTGPVGPAAPAAPAKPATPAAPAPSAPLAH